MQTVVASIILEDAYRAIDWDPDQLEPREEQMARNAFSLSLNEVWESWYWESLMKVQRQVFATPYQGIIPITLPYGWLYSNGNPVYFPATDAYYVSVWPAGPPALQPGESFLTYGYNAVGDPNLSVPVTEIRENLYGWAKYVPCAGSPQPPQWNSTLNPNLGDQCMFNGNIFQWAVPSGALPNNQPDPTLIYPATNTNPGWVLVQPFQPTLPFNPQVPDLSNPYSFLATGLTGFYGPMHTVSTLDPRTTPGGQRFHTRTSDDGTAAVILGLNVTRPFIAARRVTPIITGDDFDPTVSYTATDPQDLVFDGTLALPSPSGQIVAYSSASGIPPLPPANPGAPATAYDEDGFLPELGWNVSKQQWK